MGIEWFRDLVICIVGIITIFFTIFISVLAILNYRRIQSIEANLNLLLKKSTSVLDNIDTISESIKDIFGDVQKALVNPVTQIVGVIQGVRQGINLVSKFFKKKEEKENE